MRRMREDRCVLGTSAHVSDMRRNGLLRQFAEWARHQTCARKRASGHRFGAAWRALVVLLSGRGVLRILGAGGPPSITIFRDHLARSSQQENVSGSERGRVNNDRNRAFQPWVDESTSSAIVGSNSNPQPIIHDRFL